MSRAEFVCRESGLQNNFLRHEHHSVEVLRAGHERIGVRDVGPSRGDILGDADPVRCGEVCGELEAIGVSGNGRPRHVHPIIRQADAGDERAWDDGDDKRF